MKAWKMDIHRRIFVLLLAAGLASFCALGVVSFFGMYDVQNHAMESGREMSESAASFTENVAENQAKMRLLAVAEEKAQRVEREMEQTRRDAELLALVMERILAEPQNYEPRALPDPAAEKIVSGTPYLNISRAVEAADEDGAARQEAAYAANVADAIVPLSRFYTGVFVGSERGWLIAADTARDDGPLRFSKSFLDSYDPRKMNWYRLAADKGKAVFTDYYVDTNGNHCVTCAVPIYGANGLAGVAGVDCNAGAIYLHAAGSVKESNFVLNASGEVLFSSEKEGFLAVSDAKTDLRQSPETSLAIEASCMTQGLSDVALVTVNGEQYFLAYAPMPSTGWSFGTLIERDDVVQPAEDARSHLLTKAQDFGAALQSSFMWNLLRTVILLLALLAVLFFGSRKAAERFVRPILALTKGVKEIAKGDLDQKLDIRTGDEIEHLADCVNSMTEDLKKYIGSLSKVTAEKERVAAELNVATKIQAGMLPDVSDAVAGQKAFELYALMNPAKEVGGDFYDFYMLDERHLVVTVADVSDKGVPAALFMVAAKNVLKNAAVMAAFGQNGSEAGGDRTDFAGVMEAANRELCKNNEAKMFVTVFFGVLDLMTGEFVYVNGGHNAPLAALGGKSFEYVRTRKKGIVLGILDVAKYEAHSLSLSPGDTLFFYTDGVTEAMSSDGQLYSEERLEDVLGRVGGRDVPVKEILGAIREDIALHVGDAEPSDDITMLGLRYLG